MCEHATLYELVKPTRSVHSRLERGEQLALPTNERLLDIALGNTADLQRELAAVAANNNLSQPAPVATPSRVAEADLEIKILDAAASDDIQIGFPMSNADGVAVPGYELELEQSYADKLDTVAEKANKLFLQIVDDLFRDDELLPRLRRLFWMEATQAEQTFNNHILKPLLRNHDRNLYSDDLRAAMEVDLESVSDIEGMMRIWEGLQELEGGMLV